MYTYSNDPAFVLPTRRIILMLLLASLLIDCVSQPTPVPRAVPQATGAPVTKRELLAMLTYVEGEVYIEDPSVGRRPPGLMAQTPASRRATPFSAIRSGTTVRTSPNGRATLVYYRGQVQQVAHSSAVQVSTQGCKDCVAVPAYSTAVTSPGPTCVWIDNSCRIQGDTLEGEGDYGNIPIIISPRKTALLDPTPTLMWVAVNRKEEVKYELSLNNTTLFPTIVLEAATLNCGEHPWTKPNVICSTPWPAEWSLVPNETYFIEITALVGPAEERLPSEESRIDTLSDIDASAVKADVATVQKLALDPITENVLLAGIYASKGLWSDALLAYDRVGAALSDQPVPQIQIAMGDTYRVIDLQRFAFQAYAAALRLLDAGTNDPLLRANAEFGQGQVEYTWRNYAKAITHYKQAIELYKQIGNEEGLSAAQKVLNEAEKHIN